MEKEKRRWTAYRSSCANVTPFEKRSDMRSFHSLNREKEKKRKKEKKKGGQLTGVPAECSTIRYGDALDFRVRNGNG